MPSNKISFKNQDGVTLAARLDLPAHTQPVAYALFAHCFTCSKNLKAVGNISRALTGQGFAVLRFDFTGLGESEGDFADTNFSSNLSDLIDAASFLRSNYEAPRILVGHSLGGAAVLQVAPLLDEVEAVATIGAPCDPSHVQHLFEHNKDEILEQGEAEVSLAGRPFRIKKQFLDDLENFDAEKNIRNLKKALLIFHSPVDETVSIDNAAHIFTAARHPKSFVSLDQADHLLTDAEDSLYVGQVLAAWAHKYVKGQQAEKKQAKVASHEEVVVARVGESGYRTEINAGGHQLIADEPVDIGGTNLGPTPYGLLNAGLGACTAITLRMYADRKQWPLKSVTVRLKHDKIYAKDCVSCESEGNVKIDQIYREVELEGPLDEAQKKRLMQIADRCPVHRTLHNEVEVITELIESIDNQ